MDSLAHPVSLTQLAGAEVNLGILARWCVGKAFILTLIDPDLGKVVFLTQFHDIVVDRLRGYIRERRIVLF